MDDLRPLGRTGLTVSALTLGTSYLGNPPQESGAPAPAAYELARQMLAAPFAAIDTSNNYADGRSESVLGRALAEQGTTQGRMIFTKVDADPVTRSFDRDRVWRSFEESTARLGVNHLPLLHLHDPFHYITPKAAFAPSGPVQGLVELKEQGLVSAIGIAAGETTPMRLYVRTGAFDALLTHNRYTLVDARAEDLFMDAAARGMGTFNAAPFGGGLLAGRGSKYAYREATSGLLEWFNRLKTLCNQWSVEVPAAALHFSLRNELIDSTVVGVNNPARLEQLLQLQQAVIPQGFWEALSSLGTPLSTLAD
jgi:D-threo-aldose 1-dehydrogenase